MGKTSATATATATTTTMVMMNLNAINNTLLIVLVALVRMKGCYTIRPSMACRHREDNV